MSESAESYAGIQRAVRTLLPGLSVARYSERWSPASPAVQAFDILAEWVGREPYPDAENDAREAHVTTEYARWGMVTVAECADRITEAASLIRRAVLDPGAFVKRGPDYDGAPYGERLDQWQTRAIEAALTRVLPPGVDQ